MSFIEHFLSTNIWLLISKSQDILRNVSSSHLHDEKNKSWRPSNQKVAELESGWIWHQNQAPAFYQTAPPLWEELLPLIFKPDQYYYVHVQLSMLRLGDLMSEEAKTWVKSDSGNVPLSTTGCCLLQWHLLFNKLHTCFVNTQSLPCYHFKCLYNKVFC